MTGPDGLLKLFTENVPKTALAEETTGHLGREKNRAEPGRESTSVRNGSRTETVISDAAGEVGIGVIRDRDGTFEPRIVKKWRRRLAEVDGIVLSLYARGVTTGEISAPSAGSTAPRGRGSRSRASPARSSRRWATGPPRLPDAVCAAVFLDAIVVETRGGWFVDRPVHAAMPGTSSCRSWTTTSRSGG
ncbi:hypothetical protein GCM10022243_10230 [Saccharothrix violaceirubra]